MTARLLRGISALGLLGALVGCASMSRIEAVPVHGQDIAYERGIGVLTSRGESTTVTVVPAVTEYVAGPRMTFTVYVANDRAPTFEIDERSVSAWVDDQQVAVLTAEQLVQHVRNEAAARAWVTAIAGAVNHREAANAGYTQQVGVAQTTSYTPNGPVSAQTRFAAVSYDPERARQAQRYERARTDYSLSGIQADRDIQLQAIANSALQRTTLRPGQFIDGFVVIDVPTRHGDSTRYEIAVAAGGDLHRFRFAETRAGSGVK